MFDVLVAGTLGTRGAGAVSAWSRVESAACARRLAAMVAVLDSAHAADGSADRELWSLDTWEAVSAQIAATLGLTGGAAANLLMIAVALRDRFPKVAALFADGLITFAVVRAIVWRSRLVMDPAALAALDAALAAEVTGWGPMSVHTTEKTIDAAIAEVDPDAVRRTEARARGRSVDISVEDGSGMAELYATLYATDAEAFDARCDALADTVCEADPRTRDQRRSDAMGAMGRHQDRLACLCGRAECTAAQNPPASGVVVYVIAHGDGCDEPASPVGPVPDAPPPDDPAPDDAPAPDEAPRDEDATDRDSALEDVDSDHDTEPEPAEAPRDADTTDSAPDCSGLDGVPPPVFVRPPDGRPLTDGLIPRTPGFLSQLRPAVTTRGRFLPGPVYQRVALGAAVRRIFFPGDAPPEPRYRPSKKLADFVRCRDLTCRFPGCREPATNCDLDHTIPYPYGPTQASNLKALCRKHHLLKTFWPGWHDRQYPDGTVEWTDPEGRTYVTTPGSRLLFPELCEPTAPVTGATQPPVNHAPGLRMPRRKTTRAQDRARRIAYERELNRAESADLAEVFEGSPTPDPAPEAEPDPEPPPF